jgi:hypothetical protein
VLRVTQLFSLWVESPVRGHIFVACATAAFQTDAYSVLETSLLLSYHTAWCQNCSFNMFSAQHFEIHAKSLRMRENLSVIKHLYIYKTTHTTIHNLCAKVSVEYRAGHNEVLTAARDIPPCSPLKGSRRFRIHDPPTLPFIVKRRYVPEGKHRHGSL